MSPTPPPDAPDPIACGISGDFAGWLAGRDGSLAVTTYQANKVAVVGFDGGVHALFRQFDRPMGLAVDGPRLAVALRDQVWVLADAPDIGRAYAEPGGDPAAGRYDACYLPRLAYFTGPIDAHHEVLRFPWCNRLADGKSTAEGESVPVREEEVKTPWLQIDNVFYEARGQAWAAGVVVFE